MQPRSAKADYCAALSELRIFFAILKAWSGFVFGGKDWLDADFQRPVDGKVGIIPAQSPLRLRIVRRSHFVVEIRGVAHDQKAMRAPGWNVEPFVRIGGQHVSIPDPASRRALAQVNDHIVDRSRSHPDKLSLGRIA